MDVMTELACETAPDTAPLADPLDPADDQWAIAKELYVSGQTGNAVCMALGIRPSTFWRRAAEEGWLKKDRLRATAMAVVEDAEPIDLDAPVDDLDRATDKAWRRVCRALDAGNSPEVTRWLKIHTQLQTIRQQASRDEFRRKMQDTEALTASTMAKIKMLHAGKASISSPAPGRWRESKKLPPTLTWTLTPPLASTPTPPACPAPSADDG